jgi:hypothetical protein
MSSNFAMLGLKDNDIARVLAAKDKILAFRATGDSSVWVAPALQVDKEYSRDEHWIPAWSDTALDNTLDSIILSHQGGVGDVFRGVWAALESTNAPLSVSMSNFILNIVQHCFIAHRALYMAEHFEWVCLSVRQNCTEAQAYLAAFALPPAAIAECKDAIAAKLRDSPFFEKVQPLLSD